MADIRPGTRLRRSRAISFFRRSEAYYLYHDLWGYLLEMDRNVYDFVEAFGAGRKVGDVFAELSDRLPLEQMEGFADTLRRHDALVPSRFRERDDAFARGYPVHAPWIVWWSQSPDHAVLAYKDRGLDRVVLEPLDRLGARFFARCRGEHSLADLVSDLAEQFPDRDVEGELRRLCFRLTSSDRQVLKLIDRPIFEYLHRPPPYLRSTMPFPRVDAPEAGADAPNGDVVDLVRYHRQSVPDARHQFDVEETTLSHMFRDPHPALGGRSYGEAFLEALLERGLLPDAGAIVEIGGGVGFFAERLLGALEAEDPDRRAALAYTTLDVTPALQASQLAVQAGTGIRYLTADASRTLPLRDGAVRMVIANEVIADLETVRIRKDELDSTAGHERVRAARALVHRRALPLDDAPEVFWLNLGALALVEELARVLAPGGAAVLTEFGGRDRYPVESTHLGHSEFSIHFGHLAHVARALGLEVELTGVMDLLDMDGAVRVLSTTRSYFESLRALLARRGVRLEKIAYTKEQLRALCGERVDLDDLHELRFLPVRERALGLHPPEFLSLIIRKPH